MGITFYKEKKIFKLDTATSSYVIQIYKGNIIHCLYYGGLIPDVNFTDYVFRDWIAAFSPASPWVDEEHYSMDIAPLEYSGFGVGDFRKTAVAIKNNDGNNCTDFRYVSHNIYKGKHKLSGIPSTYANDDDECMTLDIYTQDEVTGAQAILTYTVFENYGVMTKSVKLINNSNNSLTVEKAYSASINLNGMDYDMYHLYGCHVRERNMEITPLTHGHTSISSTRGSSSHQHNPFCAIASKKATEDWGEAYGFNLVYSGSFDITADCDFYGTTRINIGINPDGFNWKLNPGEEFQTPEVVCVYSTNGLGEMSRTFHRFYSNNLIRGKWKNTKRPLLINSWEAAYFDFDTDKLVAFAKEAKELGIEMLVMDDGWFGHRNDDTSSLGDWYVNEKKLPGGLNVLIEKVNALGLKFGIWFEPEMISPNSDLFRAHQDWYLHVPNRKGSLGRNQYVIDMTRKDVRDNIYDQMKNILSKYKIDYVKWDFNRNLSEAGSSLLPAENGEEIFHRFVLGTYELMEKITSEFPDVLLENCSGGGGRFDPAMLYFSPQIWTSDNTDPIDRIPIQFGTSMCYPASTMGAHVSMCERTDFNTRGRVALWGTFGYELDPREISEEDKITVKKQIEEYHKSYDLIHNGDLYRLINPWENKMRAAWEFVSPDKSKAMFTVVIMRQDLSRTLFLRLKGLDPNKYYKREDNGEIYSGALLMNAGLSLSNMPHWTGCGYSVYFEEI